MIILATRNRHKIQEISEILGEGFAFRSLDDFPNAPRTVEDANTFAGNATKKAIELARWLTVHGPRFDTENARVLADDSGLEVDALGGAPGVHSARFAAHDAKNLSANSSDAANSAKLLQLLREVPPAKRTARFRCVVAVVPVLAEHIESSSPVCYAHEHELLVQTFEGACEGHIALEPRGSGGFGYDPLFVPVGYELTFAELGADVKNGLSHRARALAALKHKLRP